MFKYEFLPVSKNRRVNNRGGSGKALSIKVNFIGTPFTRGCPVPFSSCVGGFMVNA
jgi:hypothetical protein